MDYSRKPLGQPVLVGKMAYQIYSRAWGGHERYTARIGKPFVSKETGQFGIIAELENHTGPDFFLAARMARKQLTELAANAFQQKLQQQQADFAKKSPEPVSPITAGARGDSHTNRGDVLPVHGLR